MKHFLMTTKEGNMIMKLPESMEAEVMVLTRIPLNSLTKIFIKIKAGFTMKLIPLAVQGAREDKILLNKLKLNS